MCRFKSGIILKNRCFVPDYDSHTDMLKELGIKDDYIHAAHAFVRVELVPEDGDWWGDADTWEFTVDQDEVPDWYSGDPGRYESEFRAAVKAWAATHVLADKTVDTLASGTYYLKQCNVKQAVNTARLVLDSSTVEEMRGSSTVKAMRGRSTVKKMRDSSTVEEMWGSSTVEAMRDCSVAISRSGHTIRVAKGVGYKLEEK